MTALSLLSDEHVRLIFEASPDLYLILRADLTIVGATQAYLKATLTQAETIIGKNLFEIFPDNPDDGEATGTRNLRESLLRVIETRRADTMAVQKYDIRRPESEGGGFEERFWSPINTPMLDENGLLLYIIHRVEDVTDFIRYKTSANERLKEVAGQRDAEVFQRAQEVQEANRQLRIANAELAQREERITELVEKLKRTDSLRTQFFANVSHELRTPLTLIKGPLERLLLSASLESGLRQTLESMSAHVLLLLQHVNDLLDTSKLEAGKLALSYQASNLAMVVRESAAHFESLAQEKEIIFEILAPISLPAEIDVPKVRRILINLLSNAFKFTPTGGRIQCRVELVEGQANTLRNQACITVSDSGPGIPEHLREAVFERFFQIEDSNTRRFSGTGLGLALVQEFAGLHGGKVSLSQAQQGGARFEVHLPLSAPQGMTLRQEASHPEEHRPYLPPPVQSQADVESTSKAPPDSPLLLLVEDNADMRRFIISCLDQDYRIVTARNGEEGLQKAREIQPDLILSDWMMPRMSGMDMVKALRRQPEFHGIPIMLLTAKADEEAKVELLRGGAQDYLVKPFPVEELTARLANLVQAKRLRQALGEAKEKAEAAYKEMETFSFSVSHDLRAPLRSIASFAAMLSAEEGSSLSDQGQGYLRRILARSAKMSEMIDALLEFSRVSRKPLQKRFIDTEKMVGDLLEELQADPGSAHSEMIVGHLPKVHGDPALLRQVFANLLGNAVKYSSKSLSPRIEIQGWTEGKETRFSVSDNGIGFNMAYYNKLFGLFQTLRPQGEYEGHGIGLVLVERIVARHGGKVWGEGEEGKGARFFIALPSP